MRRSAFLAASLALLALCLGLSLRPGVAAAPRYDDDAKGLAMADRDREMQMWRDVTAQVLQQLLRANGDFGPIYHHKRNSEIINSLLGLPKTMTDAGRK